jgi:hypothetical protein
VEAADGFWQLRLEAAEETEIEVMSRVESTIRLSVFHDEGTYEPGQMITLEAAVADEYVQPGFVMSGTDWFPDGNNFGLDFYSANLR